MIEFADDPDSGVTLALDADAVTLDARQTRLHFRGDWGLSAGDDARVFGRCTQGRVSQVASLQLEAGGPAADALQVTVRGVDGRVMLGPVRLQRVHALAQGSAASLV